MLGGGGGGGGGGGCNGALSFRCTVVRALTINRSS